MESVRKNCVAALAGLGAGSLYSQPVMERVCIDGKRMVSSSAPRFTHVNVVTDWSVSEGLVTGKFSLEGEIDKCWRAGKPVKSRRHSRLTCGTTSRWRRPEQ